MNQKYTLFFSTCMYVYNIHILKSIISFYNERHFAWSGKVLGIGAIVTYFSGVGVGFRNNIEPISEMCLFSIARFVEDDDEEEESMANPVPCCINSLFTIDIFSSSWVLAFSSIAVVMDSLLCTKINNTKSGISKYYFITKALNLSSFLCSLFS